MISEKQKKKALDVSDDVLIYRGGKLVAPEEKEEALWVQEDMAYDLDFIVLDEEGALKEVWFNNAGVNRAEKEKRKRRKVSDLRR